MIPEVWDPTEGRWRLVEPEFENGYTPPGESMRLDLLDVLRDRFLTGPRAWELCRSGGADPARFVVAPDIDRPILCSCRHAALTPAAGVPGHRCASVRLVGPVWHVSPGRTYRLRGIPSGRMAGAGVALCLSPRGDHHTGPSVCRPRGRPLPRGRLRSSDWHGDQCRGE